MAVSIDELLTPLPADGSAVRDDLIYLAGLLGLTIPVVPSNPAYQIVSTLGRWGTRLWNKWAIPALRAQFGDTAAGDWLTLWARARGVDRNPATPASGPVIFENRSLVFVDISAVGAVQVSYNGNTYTSQGPAPGSTGTMGAAVGVTYLQTTLILQCDVAGTKGNVPALALVGYPTALASGPPGVYVATAASSPPAGNPVLLASDGELDAALLARTRAARALGSLYPVLDKIEAVVLSTMLPGPPPTPTATNRIRAVPTGAAITIFCATPSGPTPGSTGDPTTDLGAINARAQILLSFPGFALTVAAAGTLVLALGTITLYVTAKSNVSIASATATANAALSLWSSTVVPVGGFRKMVGGQGWIYADDVLKIAKGRINAAYPAQWLPNTQYAAGDSVSNLGQTFAAVSPGTSGSIGPTGDGGADGGDGLSWASTTQTTSSSQFEDAPGIFSGTMPSFSDTMVSPSQIPSFSWTVVVVIVDQGT